MFRPIADILDDILAKIPQPQENNTLPEKSFDIMQNDDNLAKSTTEGLC